MNSFNIADIAVILILAISTYACYKKGIIRTIYGVFSTLASIVLSRILYLPVASLLKQTFLFDTVKQYAVEMFGIDEIAQVSAQKQVEFINNLSLPSFIKEGLINGNNRSGFEIFDAQTVQDYIGAYIADFVINIAAMIIVFFVIYFVLKIICSALKIISKMPIIKTADGLGGALFGFLQGVLIIWIVLAIVSVFFTKPIFKQINESVASSVLAKQFYDSNIIIKGLSDID